MCGEFTAVPHFFSPSLHLFGGLNNCQDGNCRTFLKTVRLSDVCNHFAFVCVGIMVSWSWTLLIQFAGMVGKRNGHCTSIQPITQSTSHTLVHWCRDCHARYRSDQNWYGVTFLCSPIHSHTHTTDGAGFVFRLRTLAHLLALSWSPPTPEKICDLSANKCSAILNSESSIEQIVCRGFSELFTENGWFLWTIKPNKLSQRP